MSKCPLFNVQMPKRWCVGARCRKGDHHECTVLSCSCQCHRGAATAVTTVRICAADKPQTLEARIPKRCWPLAAALLRMGPKATGCDLSVACGLAVSAVGRYMEALFDACGMDTKQELWEFLDSRRNELGFLEGK